jgi:phosphatidylinositol-3,4,5-trisphosphate 3-phosphatase/dual-specificity protein phosphatase PTEN
MSNAIRGLVSKKKKRFQEDGYDLDLSYINKQIIAMGFPSEGREGIYRNNMKDVQRFLKQYHAGHYKVYNLCSEREYPSSSFERCARFPFDDHNPCSFLTLVEFCKDVHSFLGADPLNVAAIHCKAGKGRTGLVISSYLQWADIAANAEESLKLFAEARTKNGKGVTIPSQIRYSRYFGDFIKRYLKPGIEFPFTNPPTISLTSVILRGRADFDVGGGKEENHENCAIQRSLPDRFSFPLILTAFCANFLDFLQAVTLISESLNMMAQKFIIKRKIRRTK